MKQIAITIIDTIILFVLGWAMSLHRYGNPVVIASMLVVFISLIPFFIGGRSAHHHLGAWLVRFAGLAGIGLWVGNQSIAMWCAIAGVLTLFLLAIFWPKKDTQEHAEREEEAQARKPTTATQATKTSQQGHVLITRESPSLAWVKKNGYGIAAAIFLFAGFGAVGTMVYQVMYGNIYDWWTILVKCGIMFTCFAAAYACFLTQTGGWKDALDGAGTFATQTAAPAVGKGVGWTVKALFATLIIWPLAQLLKLASGGHGRVWQALTITILCFAARGLLFWLGIGSHIRLPAIQVWGITLGGWLLVDVLVGAGLFAGMAVLLFPWKKAGDKTAAKWNAA